MTRIGRLVAGLLLTAVAVVAPGVSASASASGESTRLALSSDGLSWSPDLTAPLFASDLRWVPGDAETHSFYARNQSGGAAVLDVSILGSRVEDLLATGDLTVSARAGNGSWTSIAAPGPHLLVRSVAVAAGHQQRISVRVALASSSSNVSQLRVLDLRLVVRLIQDTRLAVAGPSQSDGGGVDGVLPNTGGPTIHTLAFGLVLLIAGLTLVVAVRRREAEDDA